MSEVVYEINLNPTKYIIKEFKKIKKVGKRIIKNTKRPKKWIENVTYKFILGRVFYYISKVALSKLRYGMQFTFFTNDSSIKDAFKDYLIDIEFIIRTIAEELLLNLDDETRTLLRIPVSAPIEYFFRLNNNNKYYEQIIIK
jgi:hypothetical protein